MPHLILASASPRRKELLEQIGVQFSVHAMDIDESVLEDETPSAYVERLAREKASAAQVQFPDAVVLAADTTVTLGDQILGKPQSREDAVAMLNALSGETHRVMTGVALSSAEGVFSRCVTTEVTFKPLAEELIERYVDTGEPMDKAGAYGIQGKAAVLVNDIRGSYSNVVGLPLAETAELLEAGQVAFWQTL